MAARRRGGGGQSRRRLAGRHRAGAATAVCTYGNALLRKDGEYPLFDGLGSARSETNSSQSVTATLTPDAFGNTVATTGSTASKYGFAATSGYRSDGDAGLMHVGARYYDPQVGRFASRDTVLTEHPYLYCGHDPVNAVDPSGHSPDDKEVFHQWWDYLCGGIGAAAGVALGILCVGGPASPLSGTGATLGGIGGVAFGGAVGEAIWQWATHPMPPNEEWKYYGPGLGGM